VKDGKPEKMPVFRNHFAFEVARGLKAFLNLEAGLTRGAVPKGVAAGVEDGSGHRAENVVWMFGWIRTGSTWLGSMMGDLDNHRLWNEPRVGELFGTYFYQTAAHRRENCNFILSDVHRDIWLKSLRSLVLDSAEVRYPMLAKGGRLGIKEPSGSVGAPLLTEALPESRVILLVRDPRDTIASAIDAAKKGSWVQELQGVQRRQQQKGETGAGKGQNLNAEKAARRRAERYVNYVGNSKEAYEAHEGPKTLVRYEDLLTDTLGEMRRIYSELEIPVDGEELTRVVEKHSWDNIPAGRKGEGRFYRKAVPGSWREDLTGEQISAIEEVTAPLLDEFYPDGRG
jgi:hypothetical protein